MNVRELQIALRQAGVDPHRYGIEGVPSDYRLSDGTPFLARQSDGRWFLGTSERGKESTLRVFDSEEQACAYLYEYLTRPRPALEPLTPEQEAAAFARAREVEEEDRRWRERHGP